MSPTPAHLLALHAALEQSAAMHAHLCPRQVLGARMGLLAARLLQTPMPQKDKRVVAFVETDGCFADGVSAATGCWFGRRTMRLVDHGKIAVTFADTTTGECWRIHPSHQARSLAKNLFPPETRPWQAYLQGYQELSDDDLLVVRRVQLQWSLAEILGTPGSRETCANCQEEIINQRFVRRDNQTLCKACAGETHHEDARYTSLHDQ